MSTVKEPMKRKGYEKALRRLQVELCALQDWVKQQGLRVVVLFEGRDAAGKGGTIKAITERVSPRVFRVVAGLVHQLMEARDERRLLKLQAQLAAVKLLIVDELGYVPLSQTGAELLFEIFSQRHERGSTIVTSNLPFEEWTSVFGNQRLTGALLDRLTHHVHILELNGESYRLKQSKARRRRDPRPPDEVAAAADPEIGEIIRAS